MLYVELDRETRRAAGAAFIKLAARVSEMLGQRTCNDFEIPDTPTNRRLIRAAEAQAQAMTVENWERCNDCPAFQTHAGKLIAMDWELFELFAAVVADAMDRTGGISNG